MFGYPCARRINAPSALALAFTMATALPVLAQPAGLRLGLSTNQAIFGPGTTLRTALGVEYGGVPVALDLVFGVLAPDGETLVTFQGPGLSPVFGRLSQPASLRAVVSSVTLGPGLAVMVPEFLAYTWQGNEPLGTYQLFFVATPPGAFADGRIDGGDVLAVQIAPLSVRPAATIVTDPARATTALVPLTGGTVVATAADGTTFTLRVPRGALNVPTAITLTPVTAMAGVPGAMQNILAVRAEPEGLSFAVPASLAIHPATPGATQGLVGFSTSSTGSGLGLSSAVRYTNGDIVLLDVSHFSVLGSGVPATVRELILPPSPNLGSFSVRLGSLAGNPAAQQALMAEWFDTLVRPALQAGQSDTAALLLGIREFWGWETQRISELADGNVNLGEADSLRGKGLVATALRQALGRVNAACAAGQDVAAAEDVVRLQAIAWQLFQNLQFEVLVPAVFPQPFPLFGELQGLDLSAVVAGLCVRVRITEATFPSNPQVGAAAPLAVTAGLVFGANPPVFTRPLQVIADAVNASPGQRTGVTNAQGAFATTFTPTSAAVTLNVLATLVDPSLPFLSLAALTDTRTFAPGNGVAVTPSQATIAPGAARQFTATVAGHANQAVTWTVSGGGTIATTGLFTSSGTLGTFFVTATSVADANSIGVAQVTVANALTGSLAISTSASAPAVITITAVRGGAAVSFTGPIGEAAARVSQAQQHLATVTSLDFLTVLLEVPASFSLSLPDATATGDVNLISSRAAICGPSDVVPSTIAVVIGGVAAGRTLVRACGASITLTAQGSLGDDNALLVEPSHGGSVTVSATFVRTVQIGACTAGTAVLNVTRLRSFGIADTANCVLTLNGTVGLGVPFGSISVQRNVNSSLGVIRASDLNSIGIEANSGTAVAVEAGHIVTFGNPTAPFTLQNNVGIPLTAIQVGNIAGNVTLRFNTGFTNQQAQAFVAARTIGGTVAISNNLP